MHYLNDALKLADALVVSLGLVLQPEAQAGDAVGDGGDVLLAADERDNVRRELVPISCHG